MWLLIDGLNLVFRSYYGVPELKTQGGFPTHAIHGWTRTLWKLKDHYKPEHIVVILDGGRSQKRLELFPAYKANRKETPPALLEQLGKVKVLTQLLGIPIIELPAIEADDAIASLAKALAASGKVVSIVSSDKDFAQLITSTLLQIVPAPTVSAKQPWVILDPAGVRHKFGVSPEQIVEYLALIGDASDNVPGVPGVGPKTAQKWMQEWGSLEAILEQLPAIKPSRFAAVLESHLQQVRLNVELIRLQLDLDIALPAAPEEDSLHVQTFLQDLEMHTTLEAYKRRSSFV